MSGRFKIFIKWICILLVFSEIPSKAQLLQDTSALELVKRDVDYIYNMQFESAREDYLKIVKLYPGSSDCIPAERDVNLLGELSYASYISLTCFI